VIVIHFQLKGGSLPELPYALFQEARINRTDRIYYVVDFGWNGGGPTMILKRGRDAR